MKTFLRTKIILQNFHIFAQKTGVFAFFVQIQYLKVFSKDMKHLYADNIQFGGGLNFGIKHTMSTLNAYETTRQRDRVSKAKPYWYLGNTSTISWTLWLLTPGGLSNTYLPDSTSFTKSCYLTEKRTLPSHSK